MSGKRIQHVFWLAFVTINNTSILFALVLVLFIYMCIDLFEIFHRHVYQRWSSIQCSISNAQLNFMRPILCLTEVQFPPNRISWSNVKPIKVKFCLIKKISIEWTEFDSWFMLNIIYWKRNCKRCIFNQALYYFMMKNPT